MAVLRNQSPQIPNPVSDKKAKFQSQYIHLAATTKGFALYTAL
jgi:hypothetical protein